MPPTRHYNKSTAHNSSQPSNTSNIPTKHSDNPSQQPRVPNVQQSEIPRVVEPTEETVVPPIQKQTIPRVDIIPDDEPTATITPTPTESPIPYHLIPDDHPILNDNTDIPPVTVPTPVRKTAKPVTTTKTPTAVQCCNLHSSTYQTKLHLQIQAKQQQRQQHHRYLTNHVTCKQIGRNLKFHKLQAGPDGATWNNGMCNELGCLSQGWNNLPGNNTIKFIHHSSVPKNAKVTYVNPVCDICLHKEETHRVRLTAGGNLISYPYEISTPTADLVLIKTHWNSVLHNPQSRYCTFNLKDFYLNTTLPHPEWARITVKMVPPEFLQRYNLESKIYNGYIYLKITGECMVSPKLGE